MFSNATKFYTQILNADSVARQIRTRKNRVLATNTAGVNLFGVGENPFAFLKNTIDPQRIQKLVDAYCSFTPIDIEIETNTATYKIVLSNVDKNLLITAIDISAQKAVYYSLTNQLDFISDILNDFTNPLYLTDKSGKVVYANKAFCGVLGLPVKEVLEHPLSQFMIENTPDFNGIWEGISTLKTSSDTSLYHVKQVPFETQSNLFFYGSIQKYTPSATQSDLNLFQQSPIPSVLVDVVENRIQYANQAFLSIFKQSENVFHQMTLSDLFDEHSLELLNNRLSKLLNGTNKNEKFELITKPEFNEKTFNTFIGFADSNKDLIIIYLVDATERKNLELQFAHSQKMQAMGQLAGGVAHDFNNLLTAIIGFTDLLLNRHPLGDASFPDLMQIKNNANRAAGLVGQLLTFSRKQPSRIQTISVHDAFVDLSGLLERTIAPFVTLKTNFKRNLGCIKMDKNQLTQIFLNLAVNAKDAMPKGGLFTISASKEKIKKARPCGPDMMSAGDYIKIVVTDTGAGIEKKYLPRIFEPFFSTKENSKSSGTGLGLSTVYGIIRGANGFISVDSEKKIGTTFIIYLPRFDEKPIQETQEIKPIRSVSKTDIQPHILLVDDEDAVRTVSARALKAKGYLLTECTSAEQALDVLKEKTDFDLLLTDVVMPGMNGEVLSQKVKEIKPEIKIILMSGYSEDFARHGSGQNNAFSFLAKPFSLSELLEKVKEILDMPIKI